jgi:hypothetical protein
MWGEDQPCDRCRPAPAPAPANPDRCSCGAPVSPEFDCGYCDDCLSRFAEEWDAACDEMQRQAAEYQMDADYRHGPSDWAN